MRLSDQIMRQGDVVGHMFGKFLAKVCLVATTGKNTYEDSKHMRMSRLGLTDVLVTYEAQELVDELLSCGENGARAYESSCCRRHCFDVPQQRKTVTHFGKEVIKHGRTIRFSHSGRLQRPEP